MALARAGIHNPVHVVNSGQAAVEYLKGEGVYADRAAHPLPFLAFLDVRLPVRRGFDVLRWIRSQPELRALKVVMLSGSGLENEADLAERLGASLFLVKPPGFQTLVEMLAQHRDSWLQKRSTLHVARAPDAKAGRFVERSRVG